MKLERKNSKRYRLDTSLKENQNSHQDKQAIRSKHGLNKTLPVYLKDIRNNYEDENNQGHVKPKSPFNRIRSPSKKTLKALFKTGSFSNLSCNETFSPQKSHKSPRASNKQTATNSFKSNKNKSDSTSDDNTENTPTPRRPNPFQQPHRGHTHSPLNEKAIICLLSNLLDQTSAAFDRSLAERSPAVQAKGPPLENVPSQPVKMEAHVRVEKETVNSSPLANKKSPTQIGKPAVVNVIVPSFRVKTFKTRYRIEGTENLNDETYNKKHQKLENEEIKIQRWDMKWQREEYEKSLRMVKSESKGKKPNHAKNKEPATNSNNNNDNNQQESPLRSSEDSVVILGKEIALEESDMYVIRVIGDISELSEEKATSSLQSLEASDSPKQPEKKILKAARIGQKRNKKGLEVGGKMTSGDGAPINNRTRKNKRQREVSSVDTNPMKKFRNPQRSVP